jgi:O-antigen/teichoic acid export membrane protein
LVRYTNHCCGELRSHILNKIRLKNKLNESVVRRGLFFIAMVFFGFIFNYLLHYFASGALNLHEFGIFYESIVIVNLATVPAIVFGMYFTRYVANIKDKEKASAEIINYISIIKRKGIKVLLVLILVIISISIFIKIKALLLYLIIVPVIYGSYLKEALISAFEAANKMVFTGVFIMSMLFLRFLFGVSFLIIGGTVWFGMLGIMVSYYLTFFIFYRYLAADGFSGAPNFKIELWNMKSFILSFSVVSLIMYLDIVLAYFVLDAAELSMYASSSVLPKGLLLFTLPLTKVIYPMIASNNLPHTKNYWSIVLKMLGIMLFVSISGTAVLIFFSELFTESMLSINYSNIEVFKIIAISIVPLTLLRSLVTISLARGNDKGPLLLIIPVLLYVIYTMGESRDLQQFAHEFVLFSIITLVYYIFYEIYNKHRVLS